MKRGSRRSWARQNSGALLCLIPRSGDSGYGFRLKAVLQTLGVKNVGLRTKGDFRFIERVNSALTSSR